MSGKQKIGWVGLGKMGTPMSENLIKAGYKLDVYDINKESIKKLIRQGASGTDSLKELVNDSEVVISMIPDDRVLKNISISPEGILRTAQPGTIYIDMSTVSPLISAQVAKVANSRKIRYLRAPVSGSTLLAANRKLTIFVSGSKNAYNQCLEIFTSIGQKSFYVGVGEKARYFKLVINIMVGLTAAIMAEALSFGKRGGMDWKQMIEIITESVISSPLILYKAQALKERNFSPTFTVDQMIKDFDIILNTGRDMGLPLPLVSMTRKFLDDLNTQGKGSLDFFSLLTVWEEMAEIKS